MSAVVINTAVVANTCSLAAMHSAFQKPYDRTQADGLRLSSLCDQAWSVQ